MRVVVLLLLCAIAAPAFARQGESPFNGGVTGGLHEIGCTKEISMVLQYLTSAAANIDMLKGLTVKCVNAYIQYTATKTFWIKAVVGQNDLVLGVRERKPQTSLPAGAEGELAGADGIGTMLNDITADIAPDGKITPASVMDVATKLANKYEFFYSEQASEKNPTKPIPSALTPATNAPTGSPTRAPAQNALNSTGAMLDPLGMFSSMAEAMRSIVSPLTFSRRQLRQVPATLDARTDATLSKCAALEIQNQGTCGSCWAFAHAQAFGMQMCKRSTYNIAVSEDAVTACAASVDLIYDRSTNPIKEFESTMIGKASDGTFAPYNGCNGGSGLRAAIVAHKTVGRHYYVPRQCRAYSAGGNVDISASCQDASKITCSSPKQLHTEGIHIVSGVDNIKAAIYYYGAVTIGIYAEDTFQDYSSGVWTAPAGQANHAVTAVGYGSNYYVVANSWGKNWGANGFIHIITASSS